jgi:hypothetical protein
MNTIIKNVPVWDRLKGARTVDVDLEIDTYNVARVLAQRAYENKSGKSNALRNNVTVTVRK